MNKLFDLSSQLVRSIAKRLNTRQQPKVQGAHTPREQDTA